MSFFASGRTRRMGLALPLLAALALPLLGLTARAEEEEPAGRIDLAARLQPADLGPGGQGFVVVTATLGNDSRTHAEGEAELRWRPRPAPGVTYAAPAEGLTWKEYEKNPGRIEWTKPLLWEDPNFPEDSPELNWTDGHGFTLKIPVTLAEEVAPGTRVGIVFEYSTCTGLTCFMRVRGHEAVAEVGGAASIGTAPARVGAPRGDGYARATLQVEEKPGQTHGVAVVTFRPGLGMHLFMPENEDGLAITVEPLEDEGITWREVEYEDLGGVIHKPFVARIPFERSGAHRIRIGVGWRACDDTGTCFQPAGGVLEATWEGSATAPANPPPAP
ncbi:MAG: hypothetical protein ACC662_10595, partial [Planctomycetota bacterium]